MQALFNSLLRLGIISALSDKELFIDKVSNEIEQYHKNPETAEQLAKLLAAYLEDMKDNLNMNRAVKKSFDSTHVATKEDVEEINKTLQELISEFRKSEKKNSHDGIS